MHGQYVTLFIGYDPRLRTSCGCGRLIGQPLVRRDLDPQYATIDQLAEITDTMASFRDAILGMGQRIDGQQTQPVPL
ncbi:hypothetical protein AAG906_001643 [Vitis piasezkii]